MARTFSCKSICPAISRVKRAFGMYSFSQPVWVVCRGGEIEVASRGGFGVEQGTMSVLVCEEPIATDACPRCGDLAELVRPLQEEVGQLRREVATLRAEAGYWKSRHADAVKRNGQLQAELQQAHGILLVDRYSAYKAMSQVKLGSLRLAFCWSHVRRDFLEVGKGFEEWVPWALDWRPRCSPSWPR